MQHGRFGVLDWVSGYRSTRQGHGHPPRRRNGWWRVWPSAGESLLGIGRWRRSIRSAWGSRIRLTTIAGKRGERTDAARECAEWSGEPARPGSVVGGRTLLPEHWWPWQQPGDVGQGSWQEFLVPCPAICRNRDIVHYRPVVQPGVGVTLASGLPREAEFAVRSAAIRVASHSEVLFVKLQTNRTDHAHIGMTGHGSPAQACPVHVVRENRQGVSRRAASDSDRVPVRGTPAPTRPSERPTTVG